MRRAPGVISPGMAEVGAGADPRPRHAQYRYSKTSQSITKDVIDSSPSTVPESPRAEKIRELPSGTRSTTTKSIREDSHVRGRVKSSRKNREVVGNSQAGKPTFITKGSLFWHMAQIRANANFPNGKTSRLGDDKLLSNSNPAQGIRLIAQARKPNRSNPEPKGQ